MRILAISPTGGLSGVDQTFRYLCAGLVSKGVEVTAVLPKGAAIAPSLAAAGVDLEEVHHLHWWFNPGFSDSDALGAAERSRINVRHLLRLIRLRKPDLVFSNTSVMLDGVLASMMSGTPHVAHLHALFVDNIYTQMSGAFKTSIYELLANSDSTMVVPAEETRSQIINLAPACAPYIHAIPNGVDVDKFIVPVSGRTPRSGVTRILCLGHFNANKNQLLLVDVAEELIRRGVEEFVFVLAGPAEPLYLSLVKRTVQESDVVAHFEFMDAVSDVLPLLHSADIYTNCSVTETFPVSVLEAMATGLPVVATPTVGAREILGVSHAGLLGRDAEELASHFELLIRDYSKRSEMGAAGRQRVDQLYSVNTFVNNFLSVVERRVQTGRPKRASWLEHIYFGRPQGVAFEQVLKIAVLIPDRSQTSFELLIKKPFDLIKEQHFDISVDVYSYSEFGNVRLDDVNILYVFRIYADPVPELVSQARRRGIRVIFESDDNYFALQFKDGEPVHGEFKNESLERILADAHQVAVYSTEMEDQARRYSDSVVRLHPYQLTPAYLPACGDEPVIGFMGSLKKDVDFHFVIPAIERLLKERAALRIEFFGFVPDQLQGHPRVFAQPFDPDYDKFTSIFRSRRWMVAMAPLADTAFNRSKTNNKYREYAAAGYPGVYSDILPYADCVVDGETGLLVENEPDNWYKAISKLLDDNPLRQHIARNAFRDMKQRFRFEDHVSAKLELVRSVARMDVGSTLDDLATLQLMDAPPERNWQTPRPRLGTYSSIDVGKVSFCAAHIGTYRGQLCAVEVVLEDYTLAPDALIGVEIVYDNEITEHLTQELAGLQRNSVARFWLRRPLLVQRDLEVRVFGRSVFGAIKVAGYAVMPRFRKCPVLFLVGRSL